MNSFLDWLDEAAGGFIRLAYLIAGITAVAVYFGAGAMPPLADAILNAGLPWALAFALETHTYLTSRRVRAAWQERDHGALTVNAVVLALLLAFGAWNQLGYLSGTWTPPHSGAFTLPTWAAYGVRALVIPVAFMAAAFLAPLAPPITAQIEGEARATLADVFKIARKQRRVMLREAEKSGRDLTGALVELVPDDETRRIISHAYGAIRPDDAPLTTARFEATGEPHAATPEALQAALPQPPELSHISAEAIIEQVRRDLHPYLANYPPAVEEPRDDVPPPDDGGSPSFASKRDAHERVTTPLADNVTPMRRGLGRAPRQPQRDRRSVNRTNARGGKRGSAEARIRALVAREQDITHKEIQRRTRISSSTVSKWMRVIEAERVAATDSHQTA